MNNTTEALNTTNQTAWQVKDIGDIQGIFAWLQDLVSEMLTSWGYVPENVYFRLLMILSAVIVLYQIFVSGTSKAGGAFRYILMIVLVVIVLIALGLF